MEVTLTHDQQNEIVEVSNNLEGLVRALEAGDPHKSVLLLLKSMAAKQRKFTDTVLPDATRAWNSYYGTW